MGILILFYSPNLHDNEVNWKNNYDTLLSRMILPIKWHALVLDANSEWDLFSATTFDFRVQSIIPSLSLWLWIIFAIRFLCFHFLSWLLYFDWTKCVNPHILGISTFGVEAKNLKFFSEIIRKLVKNVFKLKIEELKDNKNEKIIK